MFGIAEIITGAAFTFCIGWFFVHAAKKKPPKKKLLFWGSSSLFFVLIWVAIQYTHDRYMKTGESVKLDSLPTQIKNSLVSVTDTSKPTPPKDPDKYFKAIHRANLTVQFDGIVFPVDKVPVATIVFENSGESAAKYVYEMCTLVEEDPPNAIENTYRKMTKVLDRHQRDGYDLAPRKPLTVTYNKLFIPGATITQEDSARYVFLSEQRKLSLLGAIQYYDIFGDRHVNWYCYWVHAYSSEYHSHQNLPFLKSY
ncbi:MAG: hypothetical protein ABSE41_01225 [Bacteroidota bacterium]|jgi:hypothetical protein